LNRAEAAAGRQDAGDVRPLEKRLKGGGAVFRLAGEIAFAREDILGCLDAEAGIFKCADAGF
jgi:hypothetical protein